MSIKVGFTNDNYSYNNLTQPDNKLTLNSYVNSNLISLNNLTGTTDNVFIQYKNKIATGTVGSSYVIDDIENNSRLMAINRNNIALNRNVQLLGDISIKSTLSTSNQTVTLSSNVNVILGNQNGSFIVSSNAYNILKINNNSEVLLSSDNFQLTNFSKTKNILNVTNTDMNINNNVYISNGTLYVNDIRPIGRQIVSISGIYHNETIANDFIINKKLSIIQQTQNDAETMPLEICKRYGNANIIDIYSCNFSGTKPIAFKNNLTLNKDGLLGIGTSIPDATLSIKTVASNIINYSGDKYGDVFKITQRADVGIGTGTPSAQFHVKRNDDQSNNNIRRTPMMLLDMQYNANQNYSNIYTYINTHLTYSDPELPFNRTVKIYSQQQQQIYDKIRNINSTYYLLNDDIINKISGFVNISNVELNNSTVNLRDWTFRIYANPNIETVNFTSKLVVPSGYTIYAEEDTSVSQNKDATSLGNNTIKYEVKFNIIMMSQVTANTVYDLTSSNFTFSSGGFIQVDTLPTTVFVEKYTADGNENTLQIDTKFNFVFEKILYDNRRIVRYPITFATITKALVAAPNFMNIIYNNNFISSISSDGILSLGAPVPDILKQNCLLYSSRTIYTQGLNVSQIDTIQANSNISLANKNFVDVNKITCRITDFDKCITSNLSFVTALGSSISMQNGNYNTLMVSNLIYQNIENDYSSFSYSNIHLKPRVSIGQSDASREITDKTNLRITVDSNIFLTRSTNDIITNRNGIIVTNDALSGNPCISVQTIGGQSVPYINLNNISSSYYFGIKKVTQVDVANTITNNMQLTNNNINSDRGTFFKNNSETPHIMQHIQEYNLLTFGEQNNICIDTLHIKSINPSQEYTNKSSKITLGIPYNALNRNVKDFPSYFVEEIKKNTNPYMLNIFGNVSIANINNHPIFTAQSETVSGIHSVYTAINSEPDPNYHFKVNGNMATINLKVSNDFTMNINGQDQNLRTLIHKIDSFLRYKYSDEYNSYVPP